MDLIDLLKWLAAIGYGRIHVAHRGCLFIYPTEDGPLAGLVRHDGTMAQFRRVRA